MAVGRELESMTWPLWWRCAILFNLCVFIAMGNVYTSGLAPLLVVLAKDLKISFTDSSHLSTYPLLAIGLANLVARPLAAFISKRYLLLASLVVFLAATIWNIYVTDVENFRSARVLGGFAAGIVESLGPQIIYEIFPKTHLARAMVCYLASLGLGTVFGPLLGGIVVQLTDTWPWFFKFNAIIIGANLLGCIIMLPETRHVEEEQPPAAVTHDTSVNKGEVHMKELASEAGISTPEASTISDHEPNEASDAIPLAKLWWRRSFYIAVPESRGERSLKHLAMFCIEPLCMLLTPAVLITSIIFGVVISFSVTASIVISAILQRPPKLYSALGIGILNLAGGVGLLLGVPIGGWWADWLSKRSARQNGGVHKPEARLQAFLPGAILSPLGFLVIGTGLHFQSHWIVFAVGLILQGLGITSASNVLLTYSIDCYPQLATAIAAIMHVVKSCTAFGLSYAAVPWATSSGPLVEFGVLTAVFYAVCCLVVPLYLFGERMRMSTRRLVGRLA